MSELTKQAEALGIPYESSGSGEWIRYPCSHGSQRYVIHSTIADGYLAWCEAEHRSTPDWSLHLDEVLRAPAQAE